MTQVHRTYVLTRRLADGRLHQFLTYAHSEAEARQDTAKEIPAHTDEWLTTATCEEIVPLDLGKETTR